ncbi:hypothetical protein ACWDSL_31225, partial [Streptomyces sp. NPDC000941]
MARSRGFRPRTARHAVRCTGAGTPPSKGATGITVRGDLGYRHVEAAQGTAPRAARYAGGIPGSAP